LNNDELMTPEEVAQRLRVGRTKVYELTDRGELPSIKIDRCRRIPSRGVDAFIARKLEEARMPKKQRERRRRGDGTVSVAKCDASGKPILWKASISLGTVTIDGKGRRNRPTEYAETEAEAHKKLKQLQASYLSGDDMTSNTQTVEAFLLRFLAHVKTVRSPGTYGVCESHCRVHIIPAIGGLKLKPLKTTHVQTMINSLPAKGLKPSMVTSIRRTIVRALNVARKGGEIEYNVAVDTEVPQVIQHKPPSLTEAQLDRLLDVISGNSLETLVLVALGTGGRISECLGLLWANIDREERLLHITGAIKRRKLDTPQDGKNYTTVRDPPDFTFHSLRHSCATFLIKQGEHAVHRHGSARAPQHPHHRTLRDGSAGSIPRRA
jgi:excisionase family DNA binding protein